MSAEKETQKKKATLSLMRSKFVDFVVANPDLDTDSAQLILIAERVIERGLLSEIKAQVQAMPEHADGMLRKGEVLYKLDKIEAEL